MSQKPSMLCVFSIKGLAVLQVSYWRHLEFGRCTKAAGLLQQIASHRQRPACGRLHAAVPSKLTERTNTITPTARGCSHMQPTAECSGVLMSPARDQKLPWLQGWEIHCLCLNHCVRGPGQKDPGRQPRNDSQSNYVHQCNGFCHSCKSMQCSCSHCTAIVCSNRKTHISAAAPPENGMLPGVLKQQLHMLLGSLCFQHEREWKA